MGLFSFRRKGRREIGPAPGPIPDGTAVSVFVQRGSSFDCIFQHATMTLRGVGTDHPSLRIDRVLEAGELEMLRALPETPLTFIEYSLGSVAQLCDDSLGEDAIAFCTFLPEPYEGMKYVAVTLNAGIDVEAVVAELTRVKLLLDGEEANSSAIEAAKQVIHSPAPKRSESAARAGSSQFAASSTRSHECNPSEEPITVDKTVEDERSDDHEMNPTQVLGFVLDLLGGSTEPDTAKCLHFEIHADVWAEAGDQQYPMEEGAVVLVYAQKNIDARLAMNTSIGWLFDVSLANVSFEFFDNASRVLIATHNVVVLGFSFLSEDAAYTFRQAVAAAKSEGLGCAPDMEFVDAVEHEYDGTGLDIDGNAAVCFADVEDSSEFVADEATVLADEDEYTSLTQQMHSLQMAHSRLMDTEGMQTMAPMLTNPEAVVFRDGAMSVFDLADDSVSERGSLKIDQALRQFQLHDGESSALLLGTDRNVVSQLDLARGEVVREFDAQMPVSRTFTRSKLSQRTGEQTFGAFNERAFFLMDPRTPHSVDAIQQYKQNPLFHAACTTSSGMVAVASLKGEIRLYSKFGQRAKTLLPGLGDPIIHLEVSRDGRWVLATSLAYLLLVDTRFEHRGRERTGFDARMGDAKPRPIKLRLTHNDLIRCNGRVRFLPARFDYDDRGESRILSGTGNYMIMWSMKDVLAPDRNAKLAENIRDYVIKFVPTKLVEDSFLTHSDEHFIFLTTDDLHVSSLSQLRQAPSADKR